MIDKYQAFAETLHSRFMQIERYVGILEELHSTRISFAVHSVCLASFINKHDIIQGHSSCDLHPLLSMVFCKRLRLTMEYVKLNSRGLRTGNMAC